MANVSALKGVRTRYRNTLDKEMTTATAIMGSDVNNLGKNMCLQSASKCLKLIRLYSAKLEEHMGKQTDALSESDTAFVEKVLEDDCQFVLKAETCSIEMEQFIEFLERDINKESKETEMKAGATESERMLQLQEQMQSMMLSQMEQQKSFLKDKNVKEQGNSCSVKLPKLDLIPFYGNKLKWTAFWDAFECTVHRNTRLSDIEKFNYLVSKLQGEAQRAVAGLALSNDNYGVAIGILKDRFGNKQEVVSLHYKELINIHPATYKVESLRSFLDTIEKHLRNLEVLEVNINQNVFVSMITSKLPEGVLRQLEISKGASVVWTVDNLRKEIRDYVTACEKAEKTSKEHKESLNNRQSFNKPKSNFIPKQGFNQPRKFNEHVTKPLSSTEALFTGAKSRVTHSYSDKCRYCGERHWSDECTKYTTVQERKQRLKGSCYKCLKEGHLTKECKSKKVCVHCGENNSHHRSLCTKKFGIKTSSVHLSEEINDGIREYPVENSSYESPALVSTDEIVLMQTAKTKISNPSGSGCETVRMLLDSGSQRTYITEQLATKLGLKADSEQEIKLVTFGSDKPKVLKTKSTNIAIQLNNGKYMTVTANIVPTISGTIHRNPVQRLLRGQMTHLMKSVQLADSIPTETELSSVEVLVGNDYYLDIVLPQRIEVEPGLYLLSSKLGWILTGRTGEVDSEREDTSLLIMTYGSSVVKNSAFSSIDSAIPTKPDLTDFWNVEAIGVTDQHVSSDDERAMRNFKETIEFKDNRYHVTWPWKSTNPEPPVNRELAYGRLKSCVRKLERSPELLSKYNTVIQDQLTKGVIEKVDPSTNDGIQHYIPHHAVVTPQKATTKIRVVYDASAKTRPEYNSLNECLCRGPVLLHDLCGLLMRFRLHRIALVSDIEKAFLQIGLQPSQRDVTRFLWLKETDSLSAPQDNIQEYRFCRVPFGVISSPFLLAATVEYHLDSYGTDVDVAKKLKGDIYVDNVITGTDSEVEAVELYQSAKSMLKKASMNLREWLSNSQSVNEVIPMEDRAELKDTNVLGHTWNYKSDTFAIRQPKMTDNSSKVTKRNVLKFVASVFDPLGLFAPVLLRGKLLLQDLWNRKLDWDDTIIDQEVIRRWHALCLDLGTISECQIVRRVLTNKTTRQCDGVYRLACFCDASSSAYAACVYLHHEDENGTTADLMFAKTRLAPIKGMTIPRLELMAVLIGVRCLKYVKEQLRLPVEKLYLWTDSKCVLGWINTTKDLPVFVRNRVNEIKSHGDIEMTYVNTKENSADVATRGTTVGHLTVKQEWWHGPDWLKDSPRNWFVPSVNLFETHDQYPALEALQGCEKKTEQNKALDIVAPFSIDCEKYSSVTRLLRVTAYAVRYITKLRKLHCESGPLKSEEIQEAENLWLLNVQRKHFSEVFDGIHKGKPTNIQKQLGLYIDDKGLLRSRGRLENACLSEGAKCPILLPQKDRFTQLIVERTHMQILHSGISYTLSNVRHKYWIPRGRATVRSVIKACTVCRRQEGGPYKMPPMCSLPKARVTESKPFSHTGLDYMGPLYVKTAEGSQKTWVCLFTCLVTRAVHLELVLDMSTEQFLLCLKRFIALRGSPVEIISDNAAQFKAASSVISRVWRRVLHSDDIQTYVSTKGVRWSFIVELAPWMGGFYERLVVIVKRSLRKSISRKMLQLIQLQTLIKEVEAVVNSRPLVYVGEDINSSVTLTPNHFLTLNPSTGIPEFEEGEDSDYDPWESSRERLLRMWKKGQKMLTLFWTLWRDEYLISLRERGQSVLKTSRVQSPLPVNLGDVVLIKTEGPRGSWKMGKITELVSSRDGKVRSAKVIQASGKVLSRPLKLLFPIECSACDRMGETEVKLPPPSNMPEVVVSRPVRKASELARQKIKLQV